MSRIRDIANLFSAGTDAATDAEVTAAIASHNNATTSVHGITNTASLATQQYVQDNKGIQKGNTASRPASPANGDLYYNTEISALEVYDGGWVQANIAPGIPTSVVATDSGSGRAYNNGRASVAFTAPTTTGKISSYTVTSSPGSYTATGSSSPILITGLQSSTQYTYTVSASGPYGTSAASSASLGVTATTVPQAPTINSVTGGNSLVDVAFTANATGGSSITSYTITSSPGSITASGSSSPITVTGLTNGTAYTFTMTATNANGTSAESSASSSVTPSASILIEALVIAGGGSGYGDLGGGGGAGGLVHVSSFTTNPGTSYNITVGAGGSGSTQSRIGNNSVFGSFTALGGGRTSDYADGGGQTANGGSGGGGAHRYSGGGTKQQGSGSGYTGYGNNGGSSSQNSGNGSGGGGGAGEAGQSAINNGGQWIGGKGGNGLSTFSSWGSATSSGQNVGGTYYFAGGGGGGSQYWNSGEGGYGGGGNGGSDGLSNGSARRATGLGEANTGGGGGGLAWSGTGHGGSGIVIIRMSAGNSASSTTGSPSVHTDGGFKYYKFTGSGSISF